MKKKAVSITIDEDLLEWIETQIETKRFASVSHGIEFCVKQEKEEYEKSRLQYDRKPHLEYDTRKKEEKD